MSLEWLGCRFVCPTPPPVPYRVPWFVQKSWISVNILEPFKKCNALLRFILRQGLVFCVKHLSNFGLNFFLFFVRYSTLLHLPPLRSHCVGKWWDRTQYCGDIGIDSHSARSLFFYFFRTLSSTFLYSLICFLKKYYMNIKIRNFIRLLRIVLNTFGESATNCWSLQLWNLPIFKCRKTLA
jgi:hypothetical protein